MVHLHQSTVKGMQELDLEVARRTCILQARSLLHKTEIPNPPHLRGRRKRNPCAGGKLRMGDACERVSAIALLLRAEMSNLEIA